MTLTTKPFLALVAAATLSAQTAPAPDAPLAPSGQWTVSGDESLCLLAREYGAGDARVTFGIRPAPADDRVQVVLVRPRGGSQIGDRADVAITFLPSGAKVTARAEDFRDGRRKQRITRFYMLKSDFGPLAASREIAVAIEKEPPIRLALRGTAAALKTLDLCEDKLMQHWGFDPAVQHSLSRQPLLRGSLSSLFSHHDYPADALRADQTGIVRARWTVDVNGRAVDCIVTVSSGHPSLDKAVCDKILRRARYQPALDKDGKLVVALKGGTFIFNIG